VDGPAPATPLEPARVTLPASLADLRSVATRDTLEYDGFDVHTSVDGTEHATYAIVANPAGLRGLGARACWGLSAGLITLQALHDEVPAPATEGQAQAAAHFANAYEAFTSGAYFVAFAELRHGMAIPDETPGDLAAWRFCFMLGLLRLGFARCPPGLIELATAEKAFAKCAALAQTVSPELAIQASVASAFASLQLGLADQALSRLAAARELGPELPEALYLEALAHAARPDPEEAATALCEAVLRDRGYALRAICDAETFGGVTAVATILDELARDLWQQTCPMVAASIEAARAAGRDDDDALALLDAYLVRGSAWPIYDVLFALGERAQLDERLEHTNPATTRRLARSRTGDGGVIEVLEPFRAQERYREKVVLKPATLFTREQTTWVVNTREIVHTRRVQRRIQRRETVVGSPEEGVVAALAMLAVDPASFIMGSPADEPGRAADEGRRDVVLSRGFFLGETPVTQAQWQAVLGEPVSFFKGDDRPVELVSWFDAIRFCNALSILEGLPEAYHLETAEAHWVDPASPGYRLPTEAEWELACRAGSSTPFSTGASLAPTQANFERRLGPATTPVRSFPPNPWGFHDLHGNVWEWCFDAYDPDGPPALIDPVGLSASGSRVARGGSWASGPAACRSAARAQLSPWDRKSSVGFRVAMTRQPDPPTE
jgi:formylglycine-generating enzyme required for sulfatase activity